MNKTHPGRDATCETSPFHIWSSAVYEMSGVDVDTARKYTTRERIQRAYAAGEAAWMMADEIKQRVRGGQLADRADGEVAALRRIVRRSLR